MVSLTCETTRDGGVTLVTARVTNPGRRRRVRLEHDADGAVWPPRTEGVPAAGWEGAAFECVLAEGETRAVGYATPAPVTDPLTVAETESAATETGFETHDGVPDVADSPAGVVRALGTPVPPRDAVPDDGSAEPAAPDAATGSNVAPEVDAAPEPEAGDEPATPPSNTDSGGRAVRAVDPGRTEAPPPDADAVDEWLSAVETRVEAAEELSETTAVAAATPAVRELGGLADVREAASELDDDADRLRRVAERAATLAERAEAATVPVETLDRLA